MPFRRIALAATVAFALLPASPAGADAFCRTSTVTDFAAPLTAMPPLQPVPTGRAELPFGPRGVVLVYGSRGQVVLPGAERIGIALSADRKSTARPGWLVTATLGKVDEAGSAQQVLETRRARVEKLVPKSPVHMPLSVPQTPGYYRVTIAFRDRSGKLLGRYGEYLRVLSGELDVAFLIDKPVVHPGETIDPRLENRGAADLSFGLGAPIEVLRAGAWSLAQFGNGPVPAIGIVIGPGQATSCWQSGIPADASPGTYRVALNFSYQTRTGRLPIGSGETKYAEFQVAP